MSEKNHTKEKKSVADARLQAVKSHICRPSDPPKDSPWTGILTTIRDLQKQTSTPRVGDRGFDLQKSRGKLWCRERVEKLIDPGTFYEIGSLTGKLSVEKDGKMVIVPTNQVTGVGLFGGRKVACAVDDFSLRGGHADGASTAKSVILYFFFF